MTWERQRAYDYDDGKEAGIIQGKQEKAVEDAKKLLELNVMSIEQISYVTELPIEQIHALQKESNAQD